MVIILSWAALDISGEGRGDKVKALASDLGKLLTYLTEGSVVYLINRHDNETEHRDVLSNIQQLIDVMSKKLDTVKLKQEQAEQRDDTIFSFGEDDEDSVDTIESALIVLGDMLKHANN